MYGKIPEVEQIKKCFDLKKKKKSTKLFFKGSFRALNEQLWRRHVRPKTYLFVSSIGSDLRTCNRRNRIYLRFPQT